MTSVLIYALVSNINFVGLNCMDGERMAKSIYGLGVEGRRGRGRPNMGWMEGVKSALRARGLTLEQAREIVHDRPVWRGLINGM